MGDRRYKEIICENQWYYILVPLALILLAFGVSSYWPEGVRSYFMEHYIWLSRTSIKGRTRETKSGRTRIARHVLFYLRE